jgi:uncharacterized protein with PIN domain
MAARTARIRFYAELNDFLPAGQRFRDIAYEFHGQPSVKDAIEALGVPHPEVDLVVVNGASVGFSYRVQAGDHVAVYPVFEGIDITPIVRLRERPLREPRFVADAHLGKLTRRLRMLGFDVVYRREFADIEIIRLSVREHRIILTRDRGVLKHGAVTHGYCLRSTRANEQVREVLRRFDLWRLIRPFTRCTACNGDIVEVAKQDVLGDLPPLTRRHYEQFFRCTSCRRIYWEGSHYQRMRGLVEDLARPGGSGAG